MCLGADITDYFNYGFDENTWRLYCTKQKEMREDMKSSSNMFERGMDAMGVPEGGQYEMKYEAPSQPAKDGRRSAGGYNNDDGYHRQDKRRYDDRSDYQNDHRVRFKPRGCNHGYRISVDEKDQLKVAEEGGTMIMIIGTVTEIIMIVSATDTTIVAEDIVVDVKE
jgi:hypothetical protein